MKIYKNRTFEAMFKLPEAIFAWQWNPEILPDEEAKTEGGIILPSKPVDNRPALAHFSRMVGTGVPRSWLWLFRDPVSAIAMRMIANKFYAQFSDLQLIADTLPEGGCVVRKLPLEFLQKQPLEELEVHEIWIGFDRSLYLEKFDLTLSCEAIMPAEDFLKVAAR